MEIITVSNYKGGIGKTTTAVNFAYTLAYAGKKVLLVDADPQGNTSYMVWKYSEGAKTLKDVLCGNKLLKTAIRRSRFKNLDIIPATAALEEVNKQGVEIDTLWNDLITLQIEGEKYAYDYIVIDCQPTMQALTMSALYAADIIITPFNPDGFSVAGLELMHDFIHEIEDLRTEDRPVNPICVVTEIKPDRSSVERIHRLLQQTNYNISNTVIRYSKACVTSIDVRRPLLMHRKKADATLDYIELVNEITGVDIHVD